MKKKSYKKYLKKTKKRKTIKRTNKIGGVYTVGDKEIESKSFNNFYNKYFIDFIKNCSIKILADYSRFSLIFTGELNQDIKSPYYSLRSQSFAKPIKKIIIKLTAMNLEHKPRVNFEYKLDKYDSYDGSIIKIKKEMTSIESFSSETTEQIKFSLKTCQYLEPLCPFVIYSDIHSKNGNKFLDLLLSKVNNTDNETKIILESIKSKLTENIIDGIGVIAMEIADGFLPLEDYLHDPNFKLYQNMARFQLLQLALYCGYTQGDYHMGNILVNPNYCEQSSNVPCYYENENTFVMLIDFGLSSPIPNDKKMIIKQQTDLGDYKAALTTLLNVPRLDGTICANLEVYRWLIDDENNSINTSLRELFEGRHKQIDKIISYSDEVQNIPENKFPKLPINWKKYINYMPRRFYVSKYV